MFEKIKKLIPSGFGHTITTISGFIILLSLTYKVYDMDIQISELKFRLSEMNSVIDLNDPIVIPQNFDYVYDRFVVFNPNVDSNIVIKFIQVCNEHGFDKKPIFDYMIGQILTESSAIHSKENGDVLIGVSGAVGICQIQVTTGFNYLTKKVKNRSELYGMGCSEFSFIDDESLSIEEKKVKTFNWLSDYNNNIILWGFIMNDNLKKRGVKESMVIYNSGLGGYKTYVDSGNSVDDHHYLIAINKSMSVINKSL